jgi:hypothetical protein
MVRNRAVKNGQAARSEAFCSPSLLTSYLLHPARGFATRGLPIFYFLPTVEVARHFALIKILFLSNGVPLRFTSLLLA